MFGFILFCVVGYIFFRSPLKYGKWFYYGGIELHEALSCYSNGKLKSASLWGEEIINGATFEWCSVVTFYKSGRFACGQLGRNYKYRDIIFKKGTTLYYHDNDEDYVLCGTLAEDYKDSTGRIIHCAGSEYLVCWR